jgi:predicted  nucleic acid-binding Zn-ribbon protein
LQAEHPPFVPIARILSVTHTSVLYQLQGVDSETDAKRARLDEVNALLGENQEVRDARDQLGAAEEQVQAAQARTRDVELEIATLDSKTKATTDRLYSGTVKNHKELQDMEQELEALGRRRAVLEDSLLEEMVELEESQSATEQAQLNLKAAEDKWTASQGDLADEKQSLEARLAELEIEREGILVQVDADSLAAYETLRTQRGGVAVAMVRDGVCMACGVEPTSSVAQKARHGELDARCPTCGRILYGS